MQHIHAYKLAPTYKVILMYFLVNIHISSQSTLYKVNNVLYCSEKKNIRLIFLSITLTL
jgi:hypothetical protein